MNKQSLIFVLLIILSTGLVLSQEAGVDVELQLCKAIEERMPVEAGVEFSSDMEQIYLWCKVTGMTDTTTIKHLWIYQEKQLASVSLPVRSSSFRTWSSKKLLPQWVGDWEVRVVDADDNILKSLKFTVVKPMVEEMPEKIIPDTTVIDTTLPDTTD